MDKDNKSTIIVTFDIGTESTSVIMGVADSTSTFGVNVIYQETLPSRGVAYGIVANPFEFSVIANKLWDNVKRQIKKASKIVIVANVGALSYRYVEKRQQMDLPNRPIDVAIIDELRRRAENDIYIEDTEEKSRFLDLGYSVDSGKFTPSVLNLNGSRIEARYYACYVRKSDIENINKSLPRQNSVSKTYTSASAKGALYIGNEEKNNIVALVDLGAGTTNVAIFGNGVLTFERSLPFGSATITSDIVQGLNVTTAQAEWLKQTYGLQAKEKIRNRNNIEQRYIILKDGDDEIKIDIDKYDFVARARVEEIATYVGSLLVQSRFNNSISYVMLVGGGAELQGIGKLFENSIDHPVRIPQLPGNLSNEISPKLAGAYGMLILYVRETEEADLFTPQTNTESHVPLPLETEPINQPEPTPEPAKAPEAEPQKKKNKGLLSSFADKVKTISEKLGDGSLLEEEK